MATKRELIRRPFGKTVGDVVFTRAFGRCRVIDIHAGADVRFTILDENEVRRTASFSDFIDPDVVAVAGAGGAGAGGAGAGGAGAGGGGNN